jgi:uncharacterized protein
MKPSSDVAFTDAVKRVQEERGSRKIYARAEQNGGGFRTEVDDRLEAFLTEIDTAFLSTASKDGQPYVQHRGGPKGFIKVIDEHTLGIVDYQGNRQYVTAGNLTENDRICLFLIDYENRQRVKVWGTAKVVALKDDEALTKKLTDLDYRARPEHVLVINVSAWDINCPQHIPQKLDAAEVLEVVESLQERIKALEEENASLRARFDSRS